MKLLQSFICLFAALFLCTSCYTDDKCCSEKVLFNADWNFFRVDSTVQLVDPEQVIKGIFPKGTVKVSLPHTSRNEPMVVNDQWQGYCYYSKTFSLDKTDVGKKLFLKFEGAMNVADVMINGVYLSTHLGGFLPFMIDISNTVKFDSPNTVVVRLNNEDNPVTGPKPLKELDFNTYGGIYRNVWLIKKAPVYISDPVNANIKAGGGVFVNTKNITNESADLEIKTNVVNSTQNRQNVKLQYELYDNKGRKILQEISEGDIQGKNDLPLKLETSIMNPDLWSPDTPSLYVLKTKLYVDELLADEEETQIGIREINISEKGLYLNGKKIFLRGVNRHQEYPFVGYALSDEAQYRDAYKIKEAGFDYVRASHYPQSPAFLKACDELGIFVLDAILGWQYFGDSLFMDHSKISARELIRRDRNHPCILAWELSINETPMPKEFMEAMTKIRTEEMPGSYTAGWIKDSYDIYIEARQHRKQVDLSHPLIVSEYGDWEYYAQNAGFNQDNWEDLLQEERTSRQPRESGEARQLQQATNIQEAHNDNLSTHAFADGYWAMFDYNRGYANDLEYSGIMDIFRLPKFSYYFFKSQRSISENNLFAKPMIYIASYWEPSISKSVRVYSNCDEVELYLNDRFVARKRADNDKLSKRLSHPPFTFDIACTTPGELRAIGYYKGEKLCSHIVTTAKEPAKIKLRFDESGKSPQANDLIFVYADILDSNGIIVHDASNKIKLEVFGDGEIVNCNEVITLGGTATALVKTGGLSLGSLAINASSPGLEADTIEIEIGKEINVRR